MAKKYLITIDPQTLEPETSVTITLEGGKVTFEPQDSLLFHNQLSSVVSKGKAIRPTEDAQGYFDGLDTVRGTYYYVSNEAE